MSDFHSISKPRIDHNTILIRVPAKVAYDFEKMNKVTGTVLERLGCPACHSGFDLRFDLENEFVFNEKLELLNR